MAHSLGGETETGVANVSMLMEEGAEDPPSEEAMLVGKGMGQERDHTGMEMGGGGNIGVDCVFDNVAANGGTNVDNGEGSNGGVVKDDVSADDGTNAFTAGAFFDSVTNSNAMGSNDNGSDDCIMVDNNIIMSYDEKQFIYLGRTTSRTIKKIMPRANTRSVNLYMSLPMRVDST